MTELIKKNKTKSLLGLILSLGLAMGVFIACKDQNLNQLKNLPKIEQNNHTETFNTRDLSKYFLSQKSHNWVDTKVPKDVSVFVFDTKFKEVDYFFFKKFNNWFKQLLFENGIMSLGDGGQALDCDNYAMLYKSIMNVSSYKSGQSEEFLVAVVVVKQVNEFAGIPATGNFHMLNLVFTNNGWFIFEPQTNKYIKLENYPNQEYIQYLMF